MDIKKDLIGMTHTETLNEARVVDKVNDPLDLQDVADSQESFSAEALPGREEKNNEIAGIQPTLPADEEQFTISEPAELDLKILTNFCGAEKADADAEEFNEDDIELYCENREQQLQELDALRFTLDPSEFRLYDRENRRIEIEAPIQALMDEFELATVGEQQQQPRSLETASTIVIEEQMQSIDDYRQEWVNYFQDRESNKPPAPLYLDIQVEPKDIKILRESVIAFKDKTYTQLDEDEKIKIESFPVIPLRIMLPHTYPATSLPQVKLRSRFYNQYKDKIVKDGLFGERFKENVGMPVLYDWQQYCKDELLSETFPVNFCQQEVSSLVQYEPLNSSQVTMSDFIDELITTKMLSLNQEYTTCEICFEEKIGRDKFVILNPCMHYFCKDCLVGYSESQINENRVDRLKCPSYSDPKGCKSNIREIDLVGAGLSEDCQKKLTQFSIETALAKMDDFGYCPECNGVAELTPKKNMGYCQHCFYYFCTKCDEKYHPGTRCEYLILDADAVAKHTKQNQFKSRFDSKVDINSLRCDTSQQKKIQAAIEKYYMKMNSKNCPHCKSVVVKTEGCNKMVCAQCGGFFCWSCLAKIKGYDHFQNNEKCWNSAWDNNLNYNADFFDVKSPNFNLQRFEQVMKEILSKEKIQYDSLFNVDVSVQFIKPEVSQCPMCDGYNNVTTVNSDVTCRSCQGHYCFMCNEILVEEGQVPESNDYLKHFEEGVCYHMRPILKANYSEEERQEMERLKQKAIMDNKKKLIGKMF